MPWAQPKNTNNNNNDNNNNKNNVDNKNNNNNNNNKFVCFPQIFILTCHYVTFQFCCLPEQHQTVTLPTGHCLSIFQMSLHPMVGSRTLLLGCEVCRPEHRDEKEGGVNSGLLMIYRWIQARSACRSWCQIPPAADE